MYEKEVLSNTETIIMKAIWDAGKELSFQELLDIMQATYDPNYKRTTLATFLTRLSDKGYIHSVRRGKFAYLTPAKSHDEYRTYLTKRELKYWYGGNKKDMMAALFSDGITAEDEADIRSFLNK